MLVVSGSSDGNIHVLSLCRSECRHLFNVSAHAMKSVETHPQYTSSIVMTLDERTLIRFWDISTQQCIGRLNDTNALTVVLYRTCSRQHV